MTAPAHVAVLTGSFDALPPLPEFAATHRRFACALINPGRWLLALLTYPPGEQVAVKVQLSPITCETANNGGVVRIANPPRGSARGQRLLAALERLTS